MLRVDELGAREWDAWAEMVSYPGTFQSPFLHPEYTRHAGAVAPDVFVAVLRRDGEAAGFLPFQRRGGILQPVAAPLTDYHGPALRPGARLELETVARAAKARHFDFTGLVACSGAPARSRKVLVADLSEGYRAYEAGRRLWNSKAHRESERAVRALERDHGPVEYRLNDCDEAVLAWLIALKRQQYRATGQHDIFVCGWTCELLTRLLRQDAAILGGRIATLRVGGVLIAAEYSLVSGPIMHFWLPAYDAAYRKYSPGTLLTLNTMRLAAAAGVTEAHFGTDDEPYKLRFARPVAECLERADPARARIITKVSRIAPRAGGWLDRLERKTSRRLGVIRACEASWAGIAVGTLSAAGAYGRKVVMRRR